MKQDSEMNAMPVLRKVEFPFKQEYSIMFHENDLYKVSVNATHDNLSFLLISMNDHRMWKAEFPAEYLEDISRKTGRELSFL